MAERAATLDRPQQPATGLLVADALGEVFHVVIPGVRGQRVDRDQVIELVELDRILSVDAEIPRPELDLPGRRIHEVTAFIVGLVLQGRRDLSKIELVKPSTDLTL